MKKIIVTLTFLVITQTFSFAQLKTSSSFGFRYIMPTDATADAYDNGWGLTGTSNFDIIPILGITVVGSWSTLSGKDALVDDQGNIIYANDLSIIGFTAGPYIKLGFLDLGVKGGYYFDDIHEWVILPFAEIDFWKISIGGEYKATEDVKWFSAYLNYNF
jgi:hypothetical protein